MQLEIPLDTVKTCLSLSKKKNKLTVLNPAPADKPDKETLSNIDILIPNETELSVLFGKPINTKEDIREACNFLTNQGGKIIIVTLQLCPISLCNKHHLYIDEEIKMFEAPDAIVVDTATTCDSFVVVFLSSYLNDKVIGKAIDIGQKVSLLLFPEKED